MAIIILQEKPTKENISKARKEHKEYIKITVDISQELVAIGGEYHADAEKILLDTYNSKQANIWGGGYNISTEKFETYAIINIRQDPDNQSMEIINPKIRKEFLQIVNKKLKDIKSLI